MNFVKEYSQYYDSNISLCWSGGGDPFDTPYSATSYYKSIVRNHLPEIAKGLG